MAPNATTFLPPPAPSATFPSDLEEKHLSDLVHLTVLLPLDRFGQVQLCRSSADFVPTSAGTHHGRAWTHGTS